MHDIFVRIRFLLPSLPRAEKKIADSLLENPDAITQMTLAEISRESGCSEASIIRFCKRMGFSGYSALKEAFIRSVSAETGFQDEVLNDSDSMQEIMQKVYQSNVQTLSDTLVLADVAYEQALDALLNAESIHFFGAGDAFAVCELALMKFSRLGVRCSAHSDTMLQLITAGNLTPKDVAVAISYEGRTKCVVESMRTAKKAGATTISITKMYKSPLLRYSDINLFISVNDLTVGRDKVTRRVADQFILDVLYIGYTTKSNKNFSKKLKDIQSTIDQNKL